MGDLPLSFKYKKEDDSEETNPRSPYPYIIGFALILILLGVLILLIVLKYRKGDVIEFDYDSLLEE
jgi:hypothetical protein